MNRRSLLKSLTALSAVAILPIAGCAFSVKGVLNVVISAVQGLLRVIPQSALTVNLANALAALEQAEATWETGGAAAIIIDALNTLEAVVAVIPFVAVYSPLIDVLVAGIEAIINYFNPPSVALKVARNDPHRGRVQLIAPHFLQSHQAAFAAQWDTAAESAGLVAAKIQ